MSAHFTLSWKIKQAGFLALGGGVKNQHSAYKITNVVTVIKSC